MITKKQFFIWAASIIGFLLLIGVILPWLVSAPSTIAVIGALAIIVALVGGFMFYILFDLKRGSK